MICGVIDESGLIALDTEVMKAFAATDEGIAKKQARMIASAKAQKTKRAAAEKKKKELLIELFEEPRQKVDEAADDAMDVDEE